MDEKYSILGTTLKGIADAIRRKTGKTGGLVPENMEAEIDSVKTFDDLPELSNPAGAGQILSGYEAILEDGSKVTGTIASQAAQTITPGTSNKTIAAGSYLSGAQTIKGDSNLIAANILKGKSIFGVSGSVEKKDMITGTFTGANNYNIDIANISKYTNVVIFCNDTYTGVRNGSNDRHYMLSAYIKGTSIVCGCYLHHSTPGGRARSGTISRSTNTINLPNCYAINGMVYSYIAWN